MVLVLDPPVFHFVTCYVRLYMEASLRHCLLVINAVLNFLLKSSFLVMSSRRASTWESFMGSDLHGGSWSLSEQQQWLRVAQYLSARGLNAGFDSDSKGVAPVMHKQTWLWRAVFLSPRSQTHTLHMGIAIILYIQNRVLGMHLQFLPARRLHKCSGCYFGVTWTYLFQSSFLSSVIPRNLTWFFHSIFFPKRGFFSGLESALRRLPTHLKVGN